MLPLTQEAPGGATFDFNMLLSVTCTSAKSCWAAGEYGHSLGPSETILNEMLHWNGSTWDTGTVPSPGGTASGDYSNLAGVACTSAANCWAVGMYGTVGTSPETFQNQVPHWNGHHWSLTSSPDPAGISVNNDNELSGVRCATPRSCWAVGIAQAAGHPSFNEALRWNGSKWSNG